MRRYKLGALKRSNPDTNKVGIHFISNCDDLVTNFFSPTYIQIADLIIIVLDLSIFHIM